MKHELIGPAPLQGRPMSGLERVWLVADRLLPPFVIQLVLEGEGRLRVEEVQAAVERVADALPGVRVAARGWLRGTRWDHDGALPRVRAIEADWDGQSEAGAPFLADPLSARGPVAEVLLVGDRVLFRVLHAAMDGRGLLLFAQSLFTALRGEEVPPAVGAELRDADIVTATPTPAPPRDAPPACALGAGPGTTWRRARVDGPVRQLLPRVVAALGPGRVDVPVDLRRHRPDLRSTANLTGLVRLDVGPDTDVASALRLAIDKDQHCTFVAQGERVRGLPLWLMAWAGRREADAVAARE